MPEGDTIRRAARSLEPLVGHALAVATPQPRHRLSGLSEALDGRRLESVTARGKHLLLRFEGGRTLHSHLRMSGAWDVHREGARWRRPRSAAWIVLRGAGLEAVEFSGPVLELLDDARLRLHPVLRSLGPDVLDDGFDPGVIAPRLRAGHGGEVRTIADALLDQSLACGIGNVFKSEALWACRLDPWAPAHELPDETITAVYAEASRRMKAAVTAPRNASLRIYRHPVCPRCGRPTQHRGQGDAGRVTWWCPTCQPADGWATSPNVGSKARRIAADTEEERPHS
jgi:endonuclease-8